MHPWDHARSSARVHGGTPEIYVPFHSWFDATKATLANFRHRALRHHREGIEEAVGIFGPRLQGAGNSPVDTESLGLQHLAEDVACAPLARDWLQHAEHGDLPRTWRSAEYLAEQSAMRFGGTVADFVALHAWFMASRDWMYDNRHPIMRHHAFGIFEAEARFGIVLHLTNGRAVPTRIVAERHVRSVLGSIPTASSMLRMIRPQRWMAAATSPRKLGLDEAA